MDLNSRGANSSVNSVAVGQVFVLPMAVLFNNSVVTCYYVAVSKSLPEPFC